MINTLLEEKISPSPTSTPHLKPLASTPGSLSHVSSDLGGLGWVLRRDDDSLPACFLQVSLPGAPNPHEAQ